MKRLLNTLLALTVISTTSRSIINSSIQQQKDNVIINNIEQQSNNDIITNYDYYYGSTGQVSWSGSLNHNNKRILSIVDFTDFATSWDSFIKKYPYILIDTYGEVNSPETFGNVGKDKFGTIKIYLNNVNIDCHTVNINSNNNELDICKEGIDNTDVGIISRKTYWRTLVKASSYWFMSYNAVCNLRLGLFITDNKELKLNISVESYLYSAGGYNRHLTTELRVASARLVHAPVN